MNRRRPAPLDAITLDVWYSLLYQNVAQRRAYERDRARAWTRPLVATGLTPAAATRAFRALVSAAKLADRRGVAWTLADQVDWVRRRTGAPLAASAVRAGMARAVARAGYRAAPGALETLDTLRSRGLKLALVSNVLYEDPRAMRRLLRRAGVVRRVDAIVLSAELGVGKPDPRPIREALRLLQVRPYRALHVGDQTVDVAAAWRAHVPVLRYTGVRRFWPAAHRRRLPGSLRRTPELRSWRALAAAPEVWAERARRALIRSL